MLKQPRVLAGSSVLPFVDDTDKSCPAARRVPCRAGSQAGATSDVARLMAAGSARVLAAPGRRGAEGEGWLFNRVKCSHFTPILLRGLLLHCCISPGEPGPHLPPPAHVKLRGGFCQRHGAVSLLLPALTFTSAPGTCSSQAVHSLSLVSFLQQRAGQTCGVSAPVLSVSLRASLKFFPFFPFSALNFPTPGFAKLLWQSGWDLGFVSARSEGFAGGSEAGVGQGGRGRGREESSSGAAVC